MGKSNCRKPKLEELYVALVATFRSFDQVFLVFDVLDECGEGTQRKDLLPLFHRIGENGANVFVTSRQYPEDIQESFRDSVKIEFLAKAEDIEVYIKEKINENPRARRLVKQGKCQDRRVSELSECTRGM